MLTIKRGQSVLEYAILMVIIIAALLTLQTYIKRGISGRLKSATDDIGSQYSESDGANWYKKVQTTSNTTEYTAKGVTYSNMRADGFTNTYESVQTNTTGEKWDGTQ